MAEKELDDLWTDEEEKQEGNAGDNLEDRSSSSSRRSTDTNSNNKYDYDDILNHRNKGLVNTRIDKNDGIRCGSDKKNSKVGDGKYSRDFSREGEGAEVQYTNDCVRSDFHSYDSDHNIGDNSNNNHLRSGSGNGRSRHNALTDHTTTSTGDQNRDRDRDRKCPSTLSKNGSHSTGDHSNINHSRVRTDSSSWDNINDNVSFRNGFTQAVEDTWGGGAYDERNRVSKTVSDSLWGDSDDMWGAPESKEALQTKTHQMTSHPQLHSSQEASNSSDAPLWTKRMVDRVDAEDICIRTDARHANPLLDDTVTNSSRCDNRPFFDDSMRYDSKVCMPDTGIVYGGPTLDVSTRVRSQEMQRTLVMEDSHTFTSSDYAVSSSSNHRSQRYPESPSPPLDCSLFCAEPSTTLCFDRGPPQSFSDDAPPETLLAVADRQGQRADRHGHLSAVVEIQSVIEGEDPSSVWDF